MMGPLADGASIEMRGAGARPSGNGAVESHRAGGCVMEGEQGARSASWGTCSGSPAAARAGGSAMAAERPAIYGRTGRALPAASWEGALTRARPRATRGAAPPRVPKPTERY